MKPTSKAILRQYAATFSCLMCSVMTAVCFVWFTPLMDWLLQKSNDEIQGLDNDQLAWLIASIEIGEMFGPVPCEYIADRWGRKPSILITGPLVIASWVITYFTRSILWLYVARLLQGVAIGIYYTVGPVYIAEISHPEIRGELSGHFQTVWFVGTLYVYCTGPYLSYQSYIIVSSIPAFLFLACFYFMPETPYFLMMVERRKEAEESLTWLRGDQNIQEELLSIQEAVEMPPEQRKKSGWRDLFFSKQCRKPFILITIVTIVKYLSGTTAITNFFNQTIKRSVDDPSDADLITIGMGLVLTVSSIFSALVCDSFGRKPLVTYSTLGLGVCSAGIAIYYYLERETELEVNSFSWLVYTGYAAYFIAYNTGLGPVQTTLQAECFPSNVRAAAGGYATLLSNVLCFISIKLYQVMDDNIGVYSNFVLFALVCFLGLFFLTCYMEETAKKSLGEIQKSNTCK